MGFPPKLLIQQDQRRTARYVIIWVIIQLKVAKWRNKRKTKSIIHQSWEYNYDRIQNKYKILKLHVGHMRSLRWEKSYIIKHLLCPSSSLSTNQLQKIIKKTICFFLQKHFVSKREYGLCDNLISLSLIVVPSWFDVKCSIPRDNTYRSYCSRFKPSFVPYFGKDNGTFPIHFYIIVKLLHLTSNSFSKIEITIFSFIYCSIFWFYYFRKIY